MLRSGPLMTNLVHELLHRATVLFPEKPALLYKNDAITYRQLAQHIRLIGNGFMRCDLQRHARIGVYLHKSPEAVISFFAASQSQCIYVPINPVLKTSQVQHIVNDCDIELLITNKARLQSLMPNMAQLPSLRYVILTDELPESGQVPSHINVLQWQDLFEEKNSCNSLISTGQDVAAIFYTSGSTGKPKGVVLSHQNIVLGAQSVAQYLNNTDKDVILAALPFSFDYGFSQLTTSFLSGATCVLLDYLLPRDVLKAIEQYQITGLAGVPPLWSQLCGISWHKYDTSSLRYFTNSGGVLSQANLKTLRQHLPQAAPYLMYGLTEAFRSTYLPPDEIDNRPGSIGKAIPNAEIRVLRQDGSVCDDGEPGELVHLGPLVSLGYWNNLEKTQQRFKPVITEPSGVVVQQLAVWSGDSAYRDKDGFLYFVARQDDMIKTSGYRLSPSEIEECVYQHKDVIEVAVIGASDPVLGQAILVIVTSSSNMTIDQLEQSITKHCAIELPNYMKPKKVLVLEELPHNANGKIDRSLLNKQYKTYFSDQVNNER